MLRNQGISGNLKRLDRIRYIALWNGECGAGTGGTENRVDSVRHHAGRVSILDTRQFSDLIRSLNFSHQRRRSNHE